MKILHIRLPAIADREPQHAWTCGVFGEQALDLPADLGPLVTVELARLCREQLVDLGVAVLGVIALGLAGIILDDIAVGIVDGNSGNIQSDGVILLGKPCVPARRIEDIRFANDVDLLELIDQDHRGIPVGRKIAGLNLDRQRLCIAVAELLHDRLRLSDVLFAIAAISRELRHSIRRHPPFADRLGQHCPAEQSLPFHQDGIERLGSMASDIAFRMSGLSNGGLTRFTIRLIWSPLLVISHIASGARALTSLSSGTLTSDGKVISNSPAEKASIRVARLSITRNVISSR